MLLDIHLEGVKDGIDLALQLDERNIPYLYLTSQTDPNTIQRVKETRPLGYIVKPFTEMGLRSNIELAWHNYHPIKEEYILLKTNGRIHKVNQNSILYLKAFDNYCYVVTANKKYIVPHTLKKTSELLNRNNFIRCHRSYIVNYKKITSVTRNSVIFDSESIPLSHANRDAVLSHLQG